MKPPGVRMRLRSHSRVLLAFFCLPSAGGAKLSIHLGMVENRIPEESSRRLSTPSVVRRVLDAKGLS